MRSNPFPLYSQVTSGAPESDSLGPTQHGRDLWEEDLVDASPNPELKYDFVPRPLGLEGADAKKSERYEHGNRSNEHERHHGVALHPAGILSKALQITLLRRDGEAATTITLDRTRGLETRVTTRPHPGRPTGRAWTRLRRSRCHSRGRCGCARSGTGRSRPGSRPRRCTRTSPLRPPRCCPPSLRGPSWRSHRGTRSRRSGKIRCCRSAS